MFVEWHAADFSTCPIFMFTVPVSKPSIPRGPTGETGQKVTLVSGGWRREGCVYYVYRWAQIIFLLQSSSSWKNSLFTNFCEKSILNSIWETLANKLLRWQHCQKFSRALFFKNKNCIISFILVPSNLRQSRQASYIFPIMFIRWMMKNGPCP